MTLALLAETVLSVALAVPPAPAGRALPLRCRASARGKAVLDLVKPAPRPYSLGLAGRSLSLVLVLEKGVLTMEILDDERLVDQGSWKGSRLLARARGRVTVGGPLELLLDEPALEVSCSAVRP